MCNPPDGKSGPPITLSEKFYQNGFAGLKYIPLSTRLGIFIAANVYRGIGRKIISNKKKYLSIKHS